MWGLSIRHLGKIIEARFWRGQHFFTAETVPVAIFLTPSMYILVYIFRTSRPGNFKMYLSEAKAIQVAFYIYLRIESRCDSAFWSLFCE